MSDKEKIERYLTNLLNKGFFISRYSVTLWPDMQNDPNTNLIVVWVEFKDNTAETFKVRSYEEFLTEWREW